MTFKMKARRAGWLLVVAVFAFGIVSAIRPASTSAYGLISTRSIKMSSNANGATNTIYTVGFTTTTANQTIGSIVIHFCANNPIIGDACTVPTSFDVNKSTLSIQNWSAAPVAQMTIDTTNSQQNALILTRVAGSVPANTVFSFDLGNGSTNGITNPATTNTTFFARITIYSSTTPSFSNDTNAQATEKTASDAGGVALSTANVLNVTAKVQESLVFCVYTGANCAAGGFDVRLGDPNNVLAATNTTYADSSTKFDLASNALGGVMVRLKGDTLTSGAFTITAQGDAGGAGGFACVPDSTSTSVEQFGIRVVTYGSGMVAPAAAADDFSCLAGNHKFNPTNTNTTYGENFVRTTGATDVSTTNIELAAKAAGTTEAGVYNTKLQLIATATY